MKILKSETQLNIYFDGLCPLCSREIEHYTKAKHADRLRFVDISHPRFDAMSEGLEGLEILRKFHVKKTDGTILNGVDAFQEIWRTLEIWAPMQAVASNRFTRPLLDLGYIIFAKVRPLLRRSECGSDYCETPSTKPANVIKLKKEPL